ncbi:MAG: response regulator [Bdellovibrionales bacterium]|nr:response regulator [Bdellovibrionales bacterium]
MNAKVLIVEDSPSQAAIIANVVKEAGHEPAVYSQLPMGIQQILLKEKPDLVLLDLRLLDPEGNPMADGFQLCREIKRASSNTPVIVISAEGDEDACEWAILQGADAYLQKPFVVEDLTKIMSDVLGS